MTALQRRAVDAGLSIWAIIFVLVLFWLGGQFLAFLPSPGEVVTQLPGFFTDPETYAALLVTARRVVISLVIALILGFGVAYLMARGGLAGRIASVYVNALLVVPSTIAALVALFVFRRDPVAVYVVVVLIILPFISMTLVEGIKSIDPKLRTVAQVYRFSSMQYIRSVVLPHLVPFAVASIRNENAHAWRVVVLAELFAVNSGMGWQFTRAWDRFLIIEVMLWLIAFMAILLATEYLVLVPLERFTQRWRRES
jgi:NitT/TauT family transport system permease protein